MTKEEIKDLIKDLGSKSSSIAAEIEEKFEEEKELLDTETRRKVRAIYLPVGFILGVFTTLIVRWFF